MIDIPTVTVSFERSEVGSHVDGRWVEGALELLSAQVSAQPLRASEVNMLPEGRRNTETIKFYTETKFKTSDEKNGINSDIIIYDGKKFEVMMVENWSIGTDIPYYKAIGAKIDGEGGGTNA